VVTGAPEGPLRPGDALSMSVSSLDLTSLGSPTTTSVTARRGAIELGTFPVADGTSTINLSVGDTWVGSEPLVVVAPQTGTEVRIPLTVDPADLTATPVPTVRGETRVGTRLTASAGTWTPAPVSLSYRWLRNGVAIDGANQPAYVLTPQDLGTRIAVEVTGSKLGFASVARVSESTPAVSAGTLASVKPTIRGRAKVGQRLIATPGGWRPTPVSLTYQWLRNGQVIRGATAATYTLVAADQGSRISVRVTGAKTGYTSVSQTSTATGQVAR